MNIIVIVYVTIGVWVVFRAYCDDSVNITSGSFPRISDQIGSSLYFANNRSQYSDYILLAPLIAATWPVFFCMVLLAFLRKRERDRKLEPFVNYLEQDQSDLND